MKKIKQWGFLLIAWLGVCLLLLLSACSALQKSADMDLPFYRVTITLQPGIGETELMAAIGGASPQQPELKTGHQDLSGPRILVLGFRGEPALTAFQRDLNNSAVPVLAVRIQKVN